jgi:hypothetical protein
MIVIYALEIGENNHLHPVNLAFLPTFALTFAYAHDVFQHTAELKMWGIFVFY